MVTIHGVVRIRRPAPPSIGWRRWVFLRSAASSWSALRAPLDFRTLAPATNRRSGDDDGAAGVAKYRVSFRRDEGTIVRTSIDASRKRAEYVLARTLLFFLAMAILATLALLIDGVVLFAQAADSAAADAAGAGTAAAASTVAAAQPESPAAQPTPDAFASRAASS